MLPPTSAFPLTVVPGGPITFAGSAVDDTRLTDVEIQLQNTTTRERLAADGTWGADVVAGWYRLLPANSSAASYNWSYTTPFNLVPGTYSFQVRATDNLGITTSSANYGRLTVNVQIPGRHRPGHDAEHHRDRHRAPEPEPGPRRHRHRCPGRRIGRPDRA